jgi:NodT family efflux transporter outer membrane factor (OMF) lipoprotein
MKPQQAPLWTIAALGALLGAGCSVGPKYKTPTVPVTPSWKEAPPENFKEGQGWKRAEPADTKLRSEWWTIFGDPELNALESQVNISNQNLKAAEARFNEARALIRLNRSSLFPTVTAGAGVQSGRGVRNSASPDNPRRYTNFVLPVDMSYEVDTWGRVRHSIEAAREEAQATAADLETIRLSIHSELARDYFAMRSADAQKKLLDDTVIAYEKALQLNRNLFEGGAVSGAEVAQAETQLRATQTQAVDIGIQRTQFEHAIAILIGKPPAELSLPVRPLASAPPPIPVALPSQLLERRPDIAAAERRVAEANATMGIARAAFFPSVVLGATAGFQGGSITDWLTWPNRLWAVGPSVLQTVFDAGRRRANMEAVTANYDAWVAGYRETTLRAFQEVEDNIAALRILEEETKTQRAAVESARRSVQLSTNRYTGGLVTYLEVATTQTVALENERRAVDIERQRMDASVLLIKALGGGWDVSALPSLNR